MALPRGIIGRLRDLLQHRQQEGHALVLPALCLQPPRRLQHGPRPRQAAGGREHLLGHQVHAPRALQVRLPGAPEHQLYGALGVLLLAVAWHAGHNGTHGGVGVHGHVGEQGPHCIRVGVGGKVYLR